jgi:tetratricopeptide (TPR) repeat protein
MSDLATRLMMHNQTSKQSALPTAIFGSAGNVRHALQINALPVRIGFWPIKSTDKPEIAMGLLVVLSYLLERYQGIRVYRVLAQVDGEPEAYTWSMTQSQFDVEDWQIENLDDNVGLWGALDGWNLTLEIESDLAGDDETKTLNYTAGSLAELVRLLPQAASDVMALLDVTDLNLIAPIYAAEDWDSTALSAALEQVFNWERRLYLWLWGQGWQEDQILADAERLLAAAKTLGEFGAWLAAQALARAIIFMGINDELLVPSADKIIDAFENSPLPATVLAVAVYDAQYPQLAYDWLEAEFDAGTANALTHLTAAELYRRGGQINDAVDVMQAAIEDQIADASLFRRYADLLIALEYNGLKVEKFVLLGGARRTEDDLLREAVESYESVLKLEPDDDTVLSRQLLQFLESGGYGERLWRGFDRLIAIDSAGEQTRTVIDMFHNVEDLTPAFDILKRHIAQKPDQISTYLNLAAVYILDEDGAAAIKWLDQARQITTDANTISEIERLRLSAEDPEFEMTLGEITDIINAGNSIETDDVEFLESVIEKVPDYAEIYLLLARAYIGWEETSSALETLLDGHKHVPDDPDILALLSEVVWDSGEADLAFSYLDKGILQNPHHVPLLALAGQYLFEDGQEDAAKSYLLKAEAISPNDPVLVRVRRHIARSLR